MQREKVHEFARMVSAGKGIAFDLISVAWPNGDDQLLQAVVHAMNSLIINSPNLEIDYAWKKETKYPARFFATSCSSIGYYAIGQAVATVTIDFFERYKP